MCRPIFIFLSLVFFLQACSAAVQPPTATPQPTVTPTFSLTPTSTSTPTITPSPTIIKIPTVDYNSTPTAAGFVFASPTPFPWIPTSTPIPTATPLTAGEGFEWVRTSDTIFYWGICRSNKVKVSAQVTFPDDVYSVTLFVKMRRVTGQIFTEWSKGLGMEPTGVEGIWAQDLYGSSVDNHKAWRRGWVWYQVVATGANNLEVGRSRIFMDVLRLEPCMCFTPPCEPVKRPQK